MPMLRVFRMHFLRPAGEHRLPTGVGANDLPDVIFFSWWRFLDGHAMAGCRNEFSKMPVGHRVAVHQEGVNAGDMLRALFGVVVVGPHEKLATRQFNHSFGWNGVGHLYSQPSTNPRSPAMTPSCWRSARHSS